MFNRHKLNIENQITDDAYDEHTFKNDVIKKKIDISFYRNYDIPNLINSAPLTQVVEYLVESDGSITITGANINTLTHRTVYTFRSKAKLGNQIILFSQKPHSNLT